MQAMKENIDGIQRNDTWELCEFPKDINVIGSKWVYKIKCKTYGSIERYNISLVAQGIT